MYQPRTPGFTKRDPAKRALWPGWGATLVAFPNLLVGEAKSRAFGLWLAEPSQFLHDPLPRARRFLDRFPASGGNVM